MKFALYNILFGLALATLVLWALFFLGSDGPEWGPTEEPAFLGEP